MAVYHYDVTQGEWGWFKLRTGIPTVSEMDRIVTPTGKLARNETSRKYMHRLLAEWMLGEPILSDFESEHMARGKELEPDNVAGFEFHTGLTATKIGFVTTDDGLVGCSPDRLIGDDGMLECKCPTAQVHLGYLLAEAKGTVADDYRVQVQSQLWVADRETNWASAYHPKLPQSIVRCGRDEPFITLIKTAVGEFVTEMLRLRELLSQRFGPFVRKEEEKPEDPFGITEEVADWFKSEARFQ